VTLVNSAPSSLEPSRTRIKAGHGEYLPLVGDFMSFDEIVDVLNRQGHNFSFTRVPADAFATLFPGAAEMPRCSVLSSAYLLGFGFARSNRAREQNSGPAAEQVLNVGAG
jgi:hypothetical protein